MNGYGFLADLIALIHLLFVGFVVVGLLMIVVGAVMHWQWVRSLWFRLVHLAAICFVALETLCGIQCPLTGWERELRVLGGQDASEGAFVERLIHYFLFYAWPQWVFTCLYVGFAVLVLITFLLIPPKFKATKAAASKSR